MRLSLKFSIVISSLLFITIFLMVFININQNRYFLREEVEKKGQTLAQTAATACLDPLLKKDYATLRRYCRSIALDEDVVSITILDPDLIVKMDNDINRLGESWSENPPAGEEFYMATSSINLADTIIGHIYIRMSDQKIKDELHYLVTKNIFLGFGITLAGLGLAILMARRITTPLNALTGFAEQVSEGNFATIPYSSSSDEVGILSRAFNLMILNLRKYIEARTRNERLTMAGRLSSVIAHEIRNPLEPIKGAVTMLRMKHPDDPWVKKYTDIISEEADEISDFVGNFLDFTRMSEPAFEKKNINDLVVKIKDLTEEYIRQHNNKLVLNLDPSVSDSYFDSKQIRQVLMNLILNAVQAMEGKEGLLEIFTGHDDEYIVVDVKDNGTGIEPEILEKLFDPYFTSKNEGTGLGLFISQLLIEKHGGKLYVESIYGKWTKIRVKIPVKEG